MYSMSPVAENNLTKNESPNRGGRDSDPCSPYRVSTTTGAKLVRVQPLCHQSPGVLFSCHEREVFHLTIVRKERK